MMHYQCHQTVAPKYPIEQLAVRCTVKLAEHKTYIFEGVFDICLIFDKDHNLQKTICWIGKDQYAKLSAFYQVTEYSDFAKEDLIAAVTEKISKYSNFRLKSRPRTRCRDVNYIEDEEIVCSIPGRLPTLIRCYRTCTRRYRICVMDDDVVVYQRLLSVFYTPWVNERGEPCDCDLNRGVRYHDDECPVGCHECTPDQIRRIEEERRRIAEQILVQDPQGNWCGGDQDILDCMKYWINNLVICCYNSTCTGGAYTICVGCNQICFCEATFINEDNMPCKQVLTGLFHELGHVCGAPNEYPIDTLPSGETIFRHRNSYRCHHACLDNIIRNECESQNFMENRYTGYDIGFCERENERNYQDTGQRQNLCNCQWDNVTPIP